MSEPVRKAPETPKQPQPAKTLFEQLADAASSAAASAPVPEPAAELAPFHPTAQFVRLRFHESDSGLKCIFRGRLDSVASAELEVELSDRLDAAQGKHVAFELSAVEYIASAFLRLCVMAAKRSGGDFSILNPAHEVRKVLQIAGLDRLIRAS